MRDFQRLICFLVLQNYTTIYLVGIYDFGIRIYRKQKINIERRQEEEDSSFL